MERPAGRRAGIAQIVEQRSSHNQHRTTCYEIWCTCSLVERSYYQRTNLSKNTREKKRKRQYYLRQIVPDQVSSKELFCGESTLSFIGGEDYWTLATMSIDVQSAIGNWRTESAYNAASTNTNQATVKTTNLN
jgi:hypothetical protein